MLCRALAAHGWPVLRLYRHRCHLAQLGASIDQPEEAPRRWCDWEAHGVLGELLLSQVIRCILRATDLPLTTETHTAAVGQRFAAPDLQT